MVVSRAVTSSKLPEAASTKEPLEVEASMALLQVPPTLAVEKAVKVVVPVCEYDFALSKIELPLTEREAEPTPSEMPF